MADTASKKKLQAQGLMYLASGGTALSLGVDDELFFEDFIKDFSRGINRDTPVELIGGGTPLDAAPADYVPPSSMGIGSRTYLRELITKQLADGSISSNPAAALAIKSAMSVAGYQDIDLDTNTFTAEETAALGRFNDSLSDRGVTLQELFNQNAAEQAERERLAAEARAQAEREAAAKAEQERLAQLERERSALTAAETKAKLTSTLVYGGYLPAELANNPNAVINATRAMISSTTPVDQLEAEYAKIFSDTTNWTFKEPEIEGGQGGEYNALQLLTRRLAGIAPQSADRTDDRLRADLESADPARVTLAQGYLAVTNPSLEINGKMDQATYDAGLKSLQAPLTIPVGMFNADGTLNDRNVLEMAVRGQLYLPMEALSAEDQARAMALPLAADRQPGEFYSRERFLAMKLIAEDPEAYKQLLEAENAHRATATLDNDLLVTSQENVIAAVVENHATLEAVDLPGNYAEVLTRYAADNGGAIRVEHLPFVLAQANGTALGMDGAIMDARNAAMFAGISQADLDKSIILDPKSPDFAQNVEEALRYSYVLTNTRNNGVTMDNIPEATTAELQKIAAAQVTIEETGVVTKLDTMGLPTDLLSKFQSIEGGVAPQQIATFLKLADADLNIRLDSQSAARTGYEELYGADPALDKIIENNIIDVKDPQQLAIAIQIAMAMKDGRTLEEVRNATYVQPDGARVPMLAATEAMAEGMLGTNAAAAAVKTPDAVPAPLPDGSEPATPEQVSFLQDSFKVALSSVWGGYGEDKPGVIPDNDRRAPSVGYNIA